VFAEPTTRAARTDDILNSHTGAMHVRYTFAFLSLTIASKSRLVHRKTKPTHCETTRRSHSGSRQLGEHVLMARIYHYRLIYMHIYMYMLVYIIPSYTPLTLRKSDIILHTLYATVGRTYPGGLQPITPKGCVVCNHCT